MINFNPEINSIFEKDPKIFSEEDTKILADYIIKLAIDCSEAEKQRIEAEKRFKDSQEKYELALTKVINEI